MIKILKNLNNLSNIYNAFVKFFFLIVIIPVSIKYLYYLKTMFEITITIKEKYKQFNSPDNDYDDLLIIEDTNGYKYTVTNLFFKLDFNKEEDYRNFEVGKTYKVKGYGVRNMLSPNLNVYEIIEKIN
jgi:hypothetical protein